MAGSVERGGVHQESALRTTRGRRIGALLQQQSRHGGVGVHAQGRKQRRPAVGGLGLNVRAQSNNSRIVQVGNSFHGFLGGFTLAFTRSR